MTAITLPEMDPPAVFRNGMVDPIVISVSGSEKFDPMYLLSYGLIPVLRVNGASIRISQSVDDPTVMRSGRKPRTVPMLPMRCLSIDGID